MAISFDHGPSVTSSDSPARGVMDRLRLETATLHEAAEGRAFQQSLVKGVLSKDAYIAWMGQMLALHGALERALRSLRAADTRVQQVVQDSQFRAPDLRADLAWFGAHGPPPAPRGATNEAIAEIARLGASPDLTERLGILGMHYVLEGSLNGGRFIAMAVRRAFDLTGDDGVRHMDPYGAAQRETWRAFKSAMDAQPWSAPEQDSMVAGAKAMFGIVSAMSDEMAPGA